MESIYRDVTALEEDHRHSLEALLGHPLQDNQRLCIFVLTPSHGPDAAQRRQALLGLQQVTAEIEQSLRERGVTTEQIETAIDAACEEVRYQRPK